VPAQVLEVVIGDVHRAGQVADPVGLAAAGVDAQHRRVAGASSRRRYSRAAQQVGPVVGPASQTPLPPPARNGISSGCTRRRAYSTPVPATPNILCPEKTARGFYVLAAPSR